MGKNKYKYNEHDICVYVYFKKVIYFIIPGFYNYKNPSFYTLVFYARAVNYKIKSTASFFVIFTVI